MVDSNAGPSTVAIDDVAVREVWARLEADPSSVLVDVRTKAEWSFVGVPDLSSINKPLICVEWQSFPESRVDSAFSDKLTAALDGAKVASTHEIFFICRSGARSKSAAAAMAARGYARCRNVADGFEGPLDPHRHRGISGGWKAAGLPWTQS